MHPQLLTNIYYLIFFHLKYGAYKTIFPSINVGFKEICSVRKPHFMLGFYLSIDYLYEKEEKNQNFLSTNSIA
jgi:hypothetical protein